MQAVSEHRNKKPFLALVFIAGAIICGILACLYAMRLWNHTQTMSRHFFTTSQDKTKQAVASIRDLIEKNKVYIEALAEQITHKESPKTIQETLKKRPSFLSSALISQPQGVEALSIEINDRQEYKPLDGSIDISQLHTLASDSDTGAALLTEPSTQTPSLMQARKVDDALIAAGINLHHINHILRTLYLDQSGYWFLTDQTGKILLHPNNRYAIHEKTIFDIARETGSSELSDQFEKRTDASPLYAAYANEITHAPSRAFIQKIPNTPLTLVGVFDLNEADINTDLIRKNQLLLIWWIALCLLCIVGAWLAYQSEVRSDHLWRASIAATAILLVAIGACWRSSMKYPYITPDDAQITSKKQLYETLERLQNRKKKESEQSHTIDPLNFRYKEGKYIPTGILINDISFEDHEKIEFVGYIWQRYFDGIHDGIERGFIFPQLADKPTIEQIHRSKTGNTETIIWQVCTKLNQDFNYARYPFDLENITIAIRHKEFDKNVTLVPDLDAYTIINPTSLPGVNQTTQINNWALLKSYFGYDFRQYSTNFGLYLYGPFGTYSRSEQSDVAELRFNVIAQRYLLDTIITDLLALCVIAVILFVLLLTYFSEGFEMVLETAGAAFFSTVFAQIQFRSKAPTHEFVYFEIFYFVLYAAIVLILVSTLIHLFHLRFKSIKYQHNILTKVLYWPGILATILCCTLWFLY